MGDDPIDQESEHAHQKENTKPRQHSPSRQIPTPANPVHKNIQGFRFNRGPSLLDLAEETASILRRYALRAGMPFLFPQKEHRFFQRLFFRHAYMIGRSASPEPRKKPLIPIPTMGKMGKESGFMLSDIMSALSYALDLTEGQPMGHAVKTCLIAMEIGKRLGLSDEQLTHLYFAALMKDAGCSTNSARVQAIFGGDDNIAKQAVKIIDWTKPLETVKYAYKYTLPGQSPLKKLARMIETARDSTATMDALTNARCNRGAQIALKLGFGSDTANAIMHLDEHWDGRGASHHLHGDEIPILARILCLSQTLEVLCTAFGRRSAFRIVHKRSGRWFDPEIVTVASSIEREDSFWQAFETDHRKAALQIPTPGAVQRATDTTIDQICDAFASIIDAKSSYTSEHSRRVTLYSMDQAEALGFDAHRTQELRRAALLHDIGKLGVPTAILDKPGKLTDEEFAVVKRHPAHTQEVLAMIRGFERITDIAAAHHERLDGRGYHRGTDESQLDVDMRIVAVADVFDALSAVRPYRGALSMPEVFEIMERDAGKALDADCIGILRDKYYESGVSLAA